MLGPMPFNTFSTDLDVNIKSVLIKFADDTKIGKVVNNSKDRPVTHSHLHHLVSWAHSNKTCFNAAKCEGIHLGSKTTGQPYRMGTYILESNFPEKEVGAI